VPAQLLLPTFWLLAAIARTEMIGPDHHATMVYHCDNLSTVIVRSTAAAMEVSSDGTRAILPLVDPRTSRYSNGTTTLTVLYEAIRLDGPAGNVVCLSAPGEVPWEDARRRGIEVRAVGDDPGWILEIDEGVAMTFVADGGATRLVVPISGRVIGKRHLTIAGFDSTHDIEVDVEPKVCGGSSGVTTSAATVAVDGALYRGCARILLPGVLTATVTWPDAPPVPEGAELIVQIVGAERSNAGRVLAESRSVTHGECTRPIRLEYNQAEVFGADRYVVRARIDVRSRTRWVSRSTPPVVTWGDIATVALRLTAAPR
jgi:hypothetical protein